MKKISNFQFMWSEWITPLIKDLYDQLDKDFVKNCNVQIRDLSKIGTQAEKYYQRKRQKVKKIFYGKYHKGDSKTEHRMDFHKIGAILCRTLIEYKVFNFDTNCSKDFINMNIDKYDTNWMVSNVLINFKLAFYASIVFLYQSMIFQYSKENSNLADKLRDNRKLDLYNKHIISNVNQVQESFENCVILDLAKMDTGKGSFDYFMYATILYQLEVHNIELLIKI